MHCHYERRTKKTMGEKYELNAFAFFSIIFKELTVLMDIIETVQCYSKILCNCTQYLFISNSKIRDQRGNNRNGAEKETRAHITCLYTLYTWFLLTVHKSKHLGTIYSISLSSASNCLRSI